MYILYIYPTYRYLILQLHFILVHRLQRFYLQGMKLAFAALIESLKVQWILQVPLAVPIFQCTKQVTKFLLAWRHWPFAVDLLISRTWEEHMKTCVKYIVTSSGSMAWYFFSRGVVDVLMSFYRLEGDLQAIHRPATVQENRDFRGKTSTSHQAGGTTSQTLMRKLFVIPANRVGIEDM